MFKCNLYISILLHFEDITWICSIFFNKIKLEIPLIFWSLERSFLDNLVCIITYERSEQITELWQSHCLLCTVHMMTDVKPKTIGNV